MAEKSLCSRAMAKGQALNNGHVEEIQMNYVLNLCFSSERNCLGKVDALIITLTKWENLK